MEHFDWTMKYSFEKSLFIISKDPLDGVNQLLLHFMDGLGGELDIALQLF